MIDILYKKCSRCSLEFMNEISELFSKSRQRLSLDNENAEVITEFMEKLVVTHIISSLKDPLRRSLDMNIKPSNRTPILEKPIYQPNTYTTQTQSFNHTIRSTPMSTSRGNRHKKPNYFERPRNSNWVAEKLFNSEGPMRAEALDSQGGPNYFLELESTNEWNI